MLFSSLSLAQTAYLSPDKISEGDTTKLVIEVEDTTPSLHEVDTSVLENDFEILGTASSVQMVQIQNKVTNLTRWEIELFPLKTGELEIPQLTINGVKTPKLVLSVAKPVQGSAAGEDVFIEVSAETESPYVGQQINIIVKLYHNIRIVNGTLSEPEATNADVYRIGNDISYIQTINGNRYNVLERTFALFTNTPGELTILPVSFRGQVETGARDNASVFSTLMRDVKQIKRTGNDINLKVKAIPADFSGKFWLPANDLRISQDWSEQSIDLNVGDSLNRTIKIISDGLPAEALPKDLYSSDGTLISVYPDKASRSNQDIGKKMVGKLEQRYALILSDPGYITIPELKLKWWDVDEDVEKEAVLPERVLNVAGVSTADNSISPSAQSQSLIQADSQTRLISRPANYWQWIAALLFFIWILTLILWYKSRTTVTNAQDKQEPVNQFNKNSLQQACQSHDPVRARNELIAWARQRWPDKTITGLYQLKTQASSTRFIDELSRLDQVLFSEKSGSWLGEDLWNAFTLEQQSPSEQVQIPASVIPPLYTQ